MVIRERAEEHILFLRPEIKRLDVTTAGDFQNALREQVPEKCTVLVLNLTDVEFMDSSGLGALIAAMRSLEGRGEIVLCGCRAPVVSLLRLTSLDRVFRLVDTEDEARSVRVGRIG